MGNDYASYAGQLVANGLSTNSPVTNLETGQTAPTAGVINGLMMKVGRVFIEDTRIFGDPFGGAVRKVSDIFGVGQETAAFKTGAANKKRTTGPLPVGSALAVSQLNYINWAYNIDITLYDREVNKAVLNAADAGKYAAEKLKTPLKTVSMMHYQAWKQLLANVCDGTRTIAAGSHENSDGTGGDVAYAITGIGGYAGKIDKTAIINAAPVAGTLSTISDADALLYAQTMEGIATDMMYESDDFNVLEVETFCVGKPYLFAESKTLNAMDVAFQSNASFKGFPTISARDYIKRFADIVEIDCFPDIPANVTYDTYRLAGVLIDRDALRETVCYADVESMRDAENRGTGYNYQGESIMGIWKGAPSYALLCKSA